MAEVGQRLLQQRRRRTEARFGEQGLDAGGRQQAVADGGEVARAAAVQRQARQRALQVRRFLQMRAQIFAQARLAEQMRDRVLARGDRGDVGQGRRQPFAEQARAGAGHGAVDDGEQAALALAAEGAAELEVAAGGGVDFQDRAGADARELRQARHLALLGQLDIVEDAAGGGQLGAGEGAEGVERGDLVEILQAQARILAVEARIR